MAWNWDFGDGAVSTDQNPQHTFSWGGPHTVALVVSDDSGNDSDPALDVVNLTSPVLPGFQVEIRISAGTTLTPGQLTAVQDAVTRWQEVVTGDLAEEPLSLPPNACGVPTPALSETVDDLVIYLQFTPIDGPGGILGSAGPCWVRSGSWLPALGIMSFDADDMANMESNGLLADVLLHEMGHVLGFGTLWSLDVGGGVIIHDFLRDPTDPASPTAPDSVPSNDTHFIGPFAIAAFDAVSNPDYTAGAKVPVENDNQTPEPVLGAGSLNGHWREVIFTNELMSPLIGGSTNPLSLVTVESLRDMGYDVDAASADAFSLSFSLIAGQSTTGGLVLRDDIRTGPIFFADPTGRLMMIDGVRR